MFRRPLLAALFLMAACPFYGQVVHRQNQVISRGDQVYAVVVPFAQIQVCAAGTGSSSCGAVTIYSNYALTSPITGSALVADDTGRYDYYSNVACVDEIISSPGATTQVVPYICGTAASGGGTVTSVGLTAPNIFSVTNSPITSSGNITLSLASQSANLFFASPNGASGTPLFRAIVPGDLPLTFTTNNTNGLATYSAGAFNIPHYTGVAAPLTAGHCPEFASNGIDLVDSGAACGTGGSSGFPITLGSTSIAASSTTTSVAGLTVDGVTPTTFGFLDATSSIQTQLNAKAPLASPALTGTPTAPTAAPGTNTTQLATTAFVLANAGSSSPLTTKGDLYGFNTTNARIPVGADGTQLIADSSQALGLRWGNPAVTTSAFLQAAQCNGGVAFATGFSVYDNNAPQLGCYNAAASTAAYLAFQAAPAQSQYAEATAVLPAFWTSTDITILYTAATATSGTYILEVQTACPASSGSTPGTPSFGTAATVTVTVPGTAGNQGTASITGIATAGVNGCPSASSTPSQLIYRIFRSASDTATGNIQVSGVVLATHRSQ